MAPSSMRGRNRLGWRLSATAKAYVTPNSGLPQPSRRRLAAGSAGEAEKGAALTVRHRGRTAARPGPSIHRTCLRNETQCLGCRRWPTTVRNPLVPSEPHPVGKRALDGADEDEWSSAVTSLVSLWAGPKCREPLYTSCGVRCRTVERTRCDCQSREFATAFL